MSRTKIFFLFLCINLLLPFSIKFNLLNLHVKARSNSLLFGQLTLQHANILRILFPVIKLLIERNVSSKPGFATPPPSKQTPTQMFLPWLLPHPLLMAFVLSPFLAFSLDVTNCGSETFCFWHKSGNNYVVSLILSSCSFSVQLILLSMCIIWFFLLCRSELYYFKM